MGVVETGLGSFPSFIGSWLAMMMAVMLPSSIPFVSRVAASTRASLLMPAVSSSFAGVAGERPLARFRVSFAKVEAPQDVPQRPLIS